MKNSLKTALKIVLPTFLLTLIRRKNAPWQGDYPTWDSVAKVCSGYDQSSILARVDCATEQVVRGQFAYERDSVLFEETHYSWPLTAALLWAACTQKKLNILDFGGSLGSSYRQNKKFLADIPHQWNVIEQTGFVELGKAKYETPDLHFFYSISECLKHQQVNTLFISSTLQYLQEPLVFLESTLNSYSFPVVILDRLSIVEGDKNRLTRQTVSSKIYSASMPCWFFSEEKILGLFEKKYQLIERFEAFPRNETYISGDTLASDYGYLFRLKS